MGLFGFGKKAKEGEFNSGFSGESIGGMNSQNSQNMDMSGGFPVASFDPLNESNSGLKLADLNANTDNGIQGGVDSFGNPRPKVRPENFEYRQPQSMPSQDYSKDLEIIIAKLDTIRSEINNINHRLDNIERTQKEAPPKKYPW